MRAVSSILTAVIVAAGYYMTMLKVNTGYGLGIRQERWRLCSAYVVLTGGVTFAATGLISYIRLSAFSLPQYFLTALLIWGMSVLAVTDREKQIIPNRFLLLLLLLWTADIGISVILDTAGGLALFFRGITGGLVGGVIFLLCYLLSGKQIGAGDVKLAFVMGLYLTGERIIGAIFYGVLLCAVYSIVQMCRKKLGMKDGVPVVPFLYLGTFITLFIM